MSSASRADDLLARFGSEGIQLGLERMLPLLAELGSPHLRRPAILIGGTNGKGSVAALVAAMAQKAGYRVGLFTSPYLESPNEQIRVDAQVLPSALLATYLDRILAASGRSGLVPSSFEAWTLAALLHFDAAQVDLVVLEVGLGGRRDATNVASPLLSVLTSISLDHENYLGDSLEEIAREKAGIARPHRPLIAWTTENRVEEVLAAHCAATSALFFKANELASIELLSQTRQGQEVLVRTVGSSGRHSYRLSTRLLGKHQGPNLALAVLATEALQDCGFSRINAQAITAGAASCSWPGRLEWLQAPDGRLVLLDAAHNPGGAAALALYLAELDEPYDLLFGALGDKVVGEMLPALCRGARRVALTRPLSPRSVDPRPWLGLLKDYPLPLLVQDDPLKALDDALAASERPLVICGSLFLIGPLRRVLRETYGFCSSISG